MKKQFLISLINLKTINRKTNEDVVCFFVLHGTFWLDIHHEVHTLKENSFVIINSFQDYQLTSTDDDTKQNLVLCLRFNSDSVGEYFPGQLTPLFDNFLSDEIREEGTFILKELLVRIAVVYFRDKGSERLDLYQYFLQFLSNLLKYLGSNHVVNKPPVMGRMERAITLINERYMEDLSLELIADELTMSYSHCSRLFKKEMGVSFTQYLNDVRLKYAVDDLLQNQLSVTKVAFNNGFANVKTFHQLFKKKMGVTPNEYRVMNRDKDVVVVPAKEDNYKVLPWFDSIQTLVNYLIEEDMGIKEVMVNKQLVLPAAPIQEKAFIPGKRIIKLNNAIDGLQADVQQELRVLQREIGFDLVQFNGFCWESKAYTGISIVSDYVYNNIWFDFLVEVKLRPLIALRLPEGKDKAALKSWCKEQLTMMAYFGKRYGAAELSNWYIQINAESWDEYERWTYNYLQQELKKIVGHMHIGVLGLTGLSETEAAAFADFISKQSAIDRLPDFIEFHANPYTSLQIKETYAKKFKYYQHIILTKLKKIVSDSTAPAYQPEIFLTEWNTLAGEGEGLSGTFFRSALIVEALIERADQINGVAFWLNNKVGERSNISFGDSILSVFMYRELRRPLFFCIAFVGHLMGPVIETGEGYILTRHGEDYQLLVYNSSYIDPVTTVDNYQIKNITEQLKITLTGMEQGKYRIRHYLLDKDHGGIYNEWVRAGSFEDLDQEMISYLEDRIKPKFEIIERNVDTNGSLKFSTILTLNACQLYIFRKLC